MQFIENSLDCGFIQIEYSAKESAWVSERMNVIEPFFSACWNKNRLWDFVHVHNEPWWTAKISRTILLTHSWMSIKRFLFRLSWCSWRFSDRNSKLDVPSFFGWTLILICELREWNGIDRRKKTWNEIESREIRVFFYSILKIMKFLLEPCFSVSTRRNTFQHDQCFLHISDNLIGLLLCEL